MSAKFLSIIVCCCLLSCSQGRKMSEGQQHVADTLSILSFNLWLGGTGGGQPIENSADVILQTRAKIIGLQETVADNADGTSKLNNAVRIAEILGFHYFLQSGTKAIISLYPVVDSTPQKLGVKLKISDNNFVWFFNCHLYYMPYQPYQLANKPYGDFPFIKTEAEAIHFAKLTRQQEVNNYRDEIKQVMAEGWPVFLTGDFNEPSFQDWTEKSVKAGLRQIKVEWPSTKAFSDIGMTDAYREFYPDEIKMPGETWSSLDEKGEIHDRIDFVFYKGNQIRIIDAQTIGFRDGKSGIGIPGYPSDHRAVLTRFLWEP